MKDFFIENWRILVEGLLAIVSLTCLIFRRSVKLTDSLKTLIVEWLPACISKAEASGYKGHEKLEYCIECLYVFLAKDLSREEFDKRYRSYIELMIESILSTPQKKGDLSK